MEFNELYQDVLFIDFFFLIFIANIYSQGSFLFYLYILYDL